MLVISEEKVKKLRVFAEEIRVTTLEAFDTLGFGHVGGCMSVVEVLSVLYGDLMKIDPKNPSWADRDRLVVSKGHVGPAVYATLALKGYFPMEELNTINQGGTKLPSHCDRNKTPGIDMTTGSLGQGYSAAIGIAMGNRMSGSKAYTYLIVGDGELNEGQNWEAAMFSAHYKLDNLIVFVDWNKQQLDGATKDVMDMGDLAKKFDSFGCYAQTVNGHDIKAILEAVENAKNTHGKPSVIILDTIKGKGCTLTEGVVPCHHIAFTKEQMAPALAHAREVLEQARRA